MNILFFVSKSVKCILWQICNEIVDNQDLYRNKDDFWIFKKQKNILFFNLEDFIFKKYICKMYKLYNDKEKKSQI